MSDHDENTRRNFLNTSALFFGSAVLPATTLLPGRVYAQPAPATITREMWRPTTDTGLQFGDVLSTRAIMWAKTDRPSRLNIEYSTTESFAKSVKLRGPLALETSDFTARVDLQNLPANQKIFVRATFEDLTNSRISSAPMIGSFRTAPLSARDVRFVWSGDTAGQNFGINPEFGGMRIYEAMRKVQPDFFIHSGDNIYADGPITAEVKVEDGRVWKNIVTPEVSKVAETLNEFRGRYRYNLMDENIRRFNAEVPQIWQWDDHEVSNNWSPSKDLSADSRYTEKNVPLLVARATRAFMEYAPMRYHGLDEEERIYRKISYGPLLDVFVIDMRTYRGPNTYNRQSTPSLETTYLGAAQIEWLTQGLKSSKATWKVIASDMPLGLVVPDGKDLQGRDRFENSSNGDGPALGREIEIAQVLTALKKVANVVWLTADVHYCAAHEYHPSRAQYTNFKPFWEFVAGPLNAGSFGPNPLDNTFGPKVIYQNAPKQQNTSPLAGLQFFGQVDIDAKTRTFTVALKDLDGKTVYEKTLTPEHM